MKLEEAAGKIRPCDLEKPYAFISYCSKDSERVWADVIHLQELGYNIWIDTNLKETDESWREGALAAIQDIDCRLFVFYLSRNSVVSGPCLEELECKDSEAARKQHGGREIPWIAIEVEPVGDLEGFRNSIFDSISTDTNLPRDKKNVMAATLTDLMDRYFPNNDKIRIKSLNDDHRRYDYYEKIEENFCRESVAKLTLEQLYEQSMGMFGDASLFGKATDILEYCATKMNYLPAILMMAFLYRTGIGGKKDEKKSKDQLMWASFQKDENSWFEDAEKLREDNHKEQAIALFMAYGMMKECADGYLEASKLWMRLKPPSFELTKACAAEAASLGNEDGNHLYNGLKNMPELKFIEWAQTLK